MQSDPGELSNLAENPEYKAIFSQLSEALKEYQKALDVNRNSSLAHYRVISETEEWEVVALVGRGYANAQIADELGIAHDTVRTHVRNAMNKVGARSRAHLVAKALGEGHALPT
mgnify:CR=1 FL=1